MIDLHDLDPLLEANKDSNGKYKYNGKSVPRVTEVISKMIHEDAIVTWANNLGFRHMRYKDVLNEAAQYGSKTHKAIEEYLKEQKSFSNNSFQAFQKWWLNLIENIK